MSSSSKLYTKNEGIVALTVLVNGIVLKMALINSSAWYKLLWITIPWTLVSLINMRKRKYRLHHYPVIRHFRYFSKNKTHKTDPCLNDTDNLIIHSNTQTYFMQITQQQPIIRQDDYDIIMSYLKTGESRTLFNRYDVEDLTTELKRARVIPQDQLLPPDVVGLNSSVLIKDDQGKTFELTVVTPKLANIKSRKVSVMSPIGRALIGYRKGQTISWKVPAGEKSFTILDVQ